MVLPSGCSALSEHIAFGKGFANAGFARPHAGSDRTAGVPQSCRPEAGGPRVRHSRFPASPRPIEGVVAQSGIDRGARTVSHPPTQNPLWEGVPAMSIKG